VRRALLAILLLGLTALAPATVASAATSPETIRAILRDCEDDGSLSGSYRPSELRDAVRNIGTDLDQYSACRDVISAAVLRTVSRREAPGASGSAAGGGGGAGSSTGGGGTSSGGESSGGAHFGGGALLAPDGPEEVAELSRVRDAPPESAVLGGRPVQLGLARYLYATHEPPTPLLVALALLTLGALVAGVPSIRRRLVDRRAA
jgi:hypothetical protein